MPTRRTSVDAAQLLELYKVAIEEYRFEVRLGWDRTQYFLGLESGLLSVAGGLLALVQGQRLASLAIIPVLFCGIGVALIGLSAVTTQHHYYRRTVHKKTLFEELLGLWEPVEGAVRPEENLAVASTRSMARGREILDHPGRWLDAEPLRGGTVVHRVSQVLVGLALVQALAILVICARLAFPWLP